MHKVMAFAAALSVSLVAAVASAEHEDKVDVVGGAGQVTATTKGNWHINLQYPWKVKVGSAVINCKADGDKAKCSLADTSAKLSSVPPGQAEVSVGICSKVDGQCIFTKRTVTVQ